MKIESETKLRRMRNQSAKYQFVFGKNRPNKCIPSSMGLLNAQTNMFFKFNLYIHKEAQISGKISKEEATEYHLHTYGSAKVVKCISRILCFIVSIGLEESSMFIITTIFDRAISKQQANMIHSLKQQMIQVLQTKKCQLFNC